MKQIAAVLCEGASEHAILDILLENGKLIFTELLDDKILRIRSADNFEKEYLRRGNLPNLTIYRVLDSRREKFKLSKPYRDKVQVINIITTPEIEILYILSESSYEQYCKSKMKPSDYCKIILEQRNIKSYKFVYDYFSDVDKLIKSIILYKEKVNVKKDEKSLIDIIKKC